MNTNVTPPFHGEDAEHSITYHIYTPLRNLFATNNRSAPVGELANMRCIKFNTILQPVLQFTLLLKFNLY